MGGYGRWEVYTIESRDLFFLLAISRAPWGCHCEAVAMATQNSDVRAPRNVKQSTGERERERKKDHRLSLSAPICAVVHYLRALNPGRDEYRSIKLAPPRLPVNLSVQFSSFWENFLTSSRLSYNTLEKTRACVYICPLSISIR